MRPPMVLSASSICSDRVWNNSGEELGAIEELMIDVNSGQIAYAVLVFWRFHGFWRQAVCDSVECAQAGCRKQRVQVEC